MERKEVEILLNELYREIKKSIAVKKSVNIVHIVSARDIKLGILAEFDRMAAEIEDLKEENLLMIQDNAGKDL